MVTAVQGSILAIHKHAYFLLSRKTFNSSAKFFIFFIMELGIEKLVVLEGGVGESAFCLVCP